MRAEVNGTTYDTDEAEELAVFPICHAENTLYRTEDGEFFLVETWNYLDGRRLPPLVFLEEVAPELARRNGKTPLDWYLRFRQEHVFIPLSDREAMVWCIKFLVPECFRGFLLESI